MTGQGGSGGATDAPGPADSRPDTGLAPPPTADAASEFGAGGASGAGGGTAAGGGAGGGGAAGAVDATLLDGSVELVIDGSSAERSSSEALGETNAADLLDGKSDGGEVSNVESYLGVWVRPGDMEGSLSAIEIVKKKETELSIHSYGDCNGYPCDWGIQSIAFTGPPITGAFAPFGSESMTVSSPTTLTVVSTAGQKAVYHRPALANPDAGSGASGTLKVLASGRIGSGYVAADGTAVYRTHDDGTVVRITVADGKDTTLVSGQSGWAGGIAVDSRNVYWANSQLGTVMMVPIGGGPLTTIATGMAHPLGVAVDRTDVYWANAHDGTLMKSPIDGVTITKLASAQDLPGSIAVDGTSLYWSIWSGAILKAGVAGGAATTLASGPTGLKNLAIDPTNVYWTNFSQGTVMKAPIAGGRITTIATGQSYPLGIATDGTYVYWTNMGTGANDYTDGSIARVAVDGSGLATLVSGQGYPETIAIDATSVYWLSFYGQVMSLTPR